MTVCCVIVTYGERFNFLVRVVKEVISQEIDKIVIIDNGSGNESCASIKDLAAKISSLIIAHRFPLNEGSATGFKTGLQLAARTDCDFIWLLDDDNLPEKGALQALKNFWAARINPSTEKLLALSSMRKDRQVFVNAVRERRPDALVWPKNSFLGFHVNLVFFKILERIRSSQPGHDIGNPPAMKLDASFYGGLFFHKEILKSLALPDENMVLYADDFCFTYPITLKKGEIWLVPDSVVADIDVPFYLPKKKGFLYHSSLDGKNSTQVYYATRNSLYCTKKFFLTNRFVYSINKMVFLFLITFLGLIRGKTKRLKLIFEAISDGEKGKLGKSRKYVLN